MRPTPIRTRSPMAKYHKRMIRSKIRLAQQMREFSDGGVESAAAPKAACVDGEDPKEEVKPVTTKVYLDSRVPKTIQKRKKATMAWRAHQRTK